MDAKTREEQKAINELNTGVAAEKVDWDSSISLGSPTGTAKTKADALDERTINGCNWDNIDVQSIFRGN